MPGRQSRREPTEWTSFYEETGIFPVHHVIAIRDEIVEEHPWLPSELYETFEEALDTWWAEFTSRGWFKRSPLIWSLRALEEQFEVFEDNPWEYGLTDRNRHNLSTLVSHAVDQGVLDHELKPEDLFLDNAGP